MSTHSTVYITEAKAKEYLIQNILKCDSGSGKMEELMDIFLHDELYNCCIVDDIDKNDDDILDII